MLGLLNSCPETPACEIRQGCRNPAVDRWCEICRVSIEGPFVCLINRQIEVGWKEGEPMPARKGPLAIRNALP